MENIKSQGYLEQLNTWSLNQKMELNLEKTKIMLFNFSKNYQFTTLLSIEDKMIEVVNKVKLLGTTITSDLKWDENVSDLVKRANARLILLRKLSSFKPKIEDMKTIYTSYIRSILDQSCQVWHFSLTQENADDIERVQKSALKIVLGYQYENYEKALERLNLENLQKRREKLCIKFAQKCTKNERTTQMFPKKTNLKSTKNAEEYVVNFGKNNKIPKISNSTDAKTIKSTMNHRQSVNFCNIFCCYITDNKTFLSLIFKFLFVLKCVFLKNFNQ